MTISFSNIFSKIHQPNFVNTRSFSTVNLKKHGMKLMELEKKKIKINREISEKNTSRFSYKKERSYLDEEINQLMRTKHLSETKEKILNEEIDTLLQEVAELQLEQNKIIREHNMQLIGYGTRIVYATDSQVKLE